MSRGRTKHDLIASKEPSRSHAMDRSTKSTFHFVNLKHPGDLKDDATQLRIRRLAMTEAAKARRKPKTKRERNEIVLEFRSPVNNQLRVDQVGSGEIDPFCSYPIELDDSARELLANSGEMILQHRASFLTWRSFRPYNQPLKPAPRIVVCCGTQLCSCFPQCSIKLSTLPVPEAQRILAITGRCCSFDISSQGTPGH